MLSIRAVLVLFAATALAGGCVDTKFGEVSGEIKYDGKVVEQGAITFIPADGSGPSAGSAIIDGKYAAMKVPVGRAKVSISGVHSTGKKRMYPDPKAPLVQTSSEYMPKKYNEATTLFHDVKAGAQTWNLDLPK